MAEIESLSISESENKKLKDIFIDAWNVFDDLESTDLSSNSAEFQNKVKHAMKSFEFATQIVSQIGMFSSNELVDELPTDSLPYILLPYFLGKLAQKLQNTADRVETLKVSEIYYRDFLQRCEDYELCEPKLKRDDDKNEGENRPASSDTVAQLMRAGQARNDKIAQFRQKKELDEHINQFKSLVKSNNADEETSREFFLKLLKKCILDAREDLESVKLEKQMAEMHTIRLSAGNAAQDSLPPSSSGTIAQNLNSHPHPHGHGHSHSHGHSHAPPKREPLKPFIITRDSTQKTIFGLGYPSLPVMTVNEFYDQRVREGIFPDEEKMAQINKNKAIEAARDPEEKEEEEKAAQEIQIEADDPEYIERMRRMDEYKDMVRRGDGNRYNRS